MVKRVTFALTMLIIWGCQTEPTSAKTESSSRPQRMAGGSATGNALEFLLAEPQDLPASPPPFLSLPSPKPHSLGFGFGPFPQPTKPPIDSTSLSVPPAQ